MLRFMFVNNSGTEQSIEIKTGQKIIVYALATETPAKQPEREHGRTTSKRMRLTLPSDGEIYGFVTDDAIEYVNPEPGLLAVNAISNKDPWPPPPPPPLHYRDVKDFDTRWSYFLLALGVDADKYADRSIKVKVEQ